MKLLKTAALGAAIALLGGGVAMAGDCCKDGKPCCEKNEKDELPPCCAKHDHDVPKTPQQPAEPKPDAPQPTPEHHNH